MTRIRKDESKPKSRAAGEGARATLNINHADSRN
jgi:hypothetical protein